MCFIIAHGIVSSDVLEMNMNLLFVKAKIAKNVEIKYAREILSQMTGFLYTLLFLMFLFLKEVSNFHQGFDQKYSKTVPYCNFKM